MNEQTVNPSRTPGRLKIILLAALFFLPVIASTVLYYSGWRPQAMVNRGELVHPARQIADLGLIALDGSEIRFSQLRKKWTMLYFGSAECGTDCMKAIYKMRQVQATQGKDSDRIQRVFVVTDTRALDMFRYTVKDYPEMLVIKGPEEAVGQLAKQFTLPAGSPLDGLGRIYLIDPLGNLMMSYPADADPSDMRKDLVRILKVSQIG
jgi:cytochrome oxidase Cu insertion factor (SCO1/SenC/PrrC family)